MYKCRLGVCGSSTNFNLFSVVLCCVTSTDVKKYIKYVACNLQKLGIYITVFGQAMSLTTVKFFYTVVF
jgi:hypothetical protein